MCVDEPVGSVNLRGSCPVGKETWRGSSWRCNRREACTGKTVHLLRYVCGCSWVYRWKASGGKVVPVEKRRSMASPRHATCERGVAANTVVCKNVGVGMRGCAVRRRGGLRMERRRGMVPLEDATGGRGPAAKHVPVEMWEWFCVDVPVNIVGGMDGPVLRRRGPSWRCIRQDFHGFEISCLWKCGCGCTRGWHAGMWVCR